MIFIASFRPFNFSYSQGTVETFQVKKKIINKQTKKQYYLAERPVEISVCRHWLPNHGAKITNLI